MHQVVWPLRRLQNRAGEFVGYVMPRIEGAEPLHILFRSAESLGQPFGFTERLHVAVQLAEVFELMHKLRIVIGDASSNNFLVNAGADGRHRVHLIDVDSVQLPGSSERTRTERYLLPEEARAGDKVPLTPTIRSDLHALSFLLFELFMHGASPYQHVGGGSPRENLERGYFPYTVRAADKAAPPMNAPLWPKLPQAVREAFVASITGRRRTPSEWAELLRSCSDPAERPGFFSFLFPPFKRKRPA